MLLALHEQLQADVGLLLDVALDVLIATPLQKPQDTCRICRTTWRTSLAGVLRRFVCTVFTQKKLALKQVRQALERLENGTFGVCADCGRNIDADSLDVTPCRTRCVECGSRQAAA